MTHSELNVCHKKEFSWQEASSIQKACNPLNKDLHMN